MAATKKAQAYRVKGPAHDIPGGLDDWRLDYLNRAGRACTARIGDVVDDLPALSIPWLLAQGLIEAVAEEPGQPAVDAPPAE